MKGIHIEVILAASYAFFLLIVALILEWAAHNTHIRAKLYRHRGFRFHQHLDVWECPAGEHLHRRETDHVRRLVRYRARAEKCNSCALKVHCTDSDEGREVVHSAEDWMDTEVGRFHRGISLVLLSLGALIVIVFWVRHHRALESAILAGTLTAMIVAAFAFARSFWNGNFGNPTEASGQAGLLSLSPWSDTPDGLRG
jgi:hypothetical protein